MLEKEEPTVKLVSRKRNRSETIAGASTAPKAGAVLLIGKQSSLRSLYKFSPAKKKTPKKCVVFVEPSESVQKRPKVTIKPFPAAGAESEKDKQASEAEKEKAAEEEKRKAEERKKKVEEEKKRKAEEEKRRQAEEDEKKAEEAKRKRAPEKPSGDGAKRSRTVHIVGLDQPHHEKRKEPEVEMVTHSLKTSSARVKLCFFGKTRRIALFSNRPPGYFGRHLL
ncbi:putative igA-specific serine endopeptidase [Helianthus anomalus]